MTTRPTRATEKPHEQWRAQLPSSTSRNQPGQQKRYKKNQRPRPHHLSTTTGLL
ncbi:hypothetical protein L210DRAFT_3519559, partial [Boletus edulis BED1]